MPPLPEYRARELVKNIEVVRVPDLGEGLRRFASGIGALADTVGRFDGTDTAPETAESDDATLAAADEPRARSYYVDTFEQSTALRAEEFAARFADDPAAFPPVWRAHAKGALAQAPEPWRPAMAGVLDRVGRSAFASLLERKQAADDARARDAWQQGLARKFSRLAGLSYADDFGGEEYLEDAAAFEDHLSRGVAAGIIDRETAAHYRHRAADEGAATALARAAFADVFSADADDPTAFERHLNARLDDPETAVPEDRRGVIVPLARAAYQRLAADRRVALAGLRDEADKIEARLHRGDTRDAARLHELTGNAARLGDAALTDDLRRRADALPALQAFARLPLAAQAEVVDAADASDERTAALRRLHREKDRALGRDPWAYGIEAHGDRLGPVSALDVTKPEALAGALKARAPQADRIAAYEGVPVAPLSRDEIGRLADAIEAGDAGLNATLLAAVHDGLGAKHAAAVFEKLAAFGGTAATAAVAGALYGDDPKLARDVLKGDALRRDNPKLIPEDDVEAAIAERLFGFDALDADARDRIIDATLALYAKDAAERGDDSGALNERRLDAVLQRAADGLNSSVAVSAGTDDDLLKRMLAPLLDARPDLAGPIADILAAGPHDPERLARLVKNFGSIGRAVAVANEAFRMLRKALDPDRAREQSDDQQTERSETDQTNENSDVKVLEERSQGLQPGLPPAHSTEHSSPLPPIATGEARYRLIGNREFVARVDGSLDFGALSEPVAEAIGREPGPIRLPKGKPNKTGELHMERGGKADEIRAAGYPDAAHLVDDIGHNFNEVWSGKQDTLLLVKRGESGRRTPMMYVEIRKPPSGNYWEVKSGGIWWSGYPAEGDRKMLWRRETSADGHREAGAASDNPYAEPGRDGRNASDQSYK